MELEFKIKFYYNFLMSESLVKQCYSLLLNLIRAKYEGKINLKTLKNLFNFIEIFSLRFTSIANRSPSGLEAIYSNTAIQITKNNDQSIINREIESFKKKLLDKSPSKEAIIDVLKEFRLDNKNKNLVKYILIKLSYDTPFDEETANNISIEHIFPLKPGIGWDSSLPPQDRLLLGNLTILSPTLNKQASNLSFERKKDLYKQSELSINAYFETINSWGKEQILERHNKLIEKVESLFRLKL